MDTEILKFLEDRKLTSKSSLTRESLEALFDSAWVPSLKNEISNTGFACDFYTDVNTTENKNFSLQMEGL